jgi:hypothetical protein
VNEGKERIVERKGHEYLVVTVSGATLWRFWIDTLPPTEPWEPVIITGHVYDSADEALDAGEAWLAKPYSLPHVPREAIDRAKATLACIEAT